MFNFFDIPQFFYLILKLGKICYCKKSNIKSEHFKKSRDQYLNRKATANDSLRFWGVSKECICHPVENESFTFFLGHFIINWFTQILDSYGTGRVTVNGICNEFRWKSQYFGQDLFGETQKSHFFGKVLFCVIFSVFFRVLSN